MAVKTKYALKQYDLTKGQSSPRGPARPQGMLPRALRELRYEADVLTSRPTLTSFAGTYSAENDLSADSLSDGDYLSGDVTNICSDGRRVFGQITLSEGSSEEPQPGLGSNSYVVEMVKVGSSYAWKKTSIPAPVAAAPIASFGPYSAASFGSGAGSQLLFTNWGPTASDDTPMFHTLEGGNSVGDPMAMRKTSLLTRFPNLGVTRAVGNGYCVAYDTVALCFRLIYLDGVKISTWRLRGTSTATPTAYDATGWDARIVNSKLYLVTSSVVGASSSQDRDHYVYTVPSPSTGTYGTTSVDLAATATSNATVATKNNVKIAISSQSSPTSIRYADLSDDSGGAIIRSVRIHATSVAVDTTVTATVSDDYGRAITCNGNLIIVETSASSADEFTSANILIAIVPKRYSSTTRFFVLSSGVLTEVSGWAATGDRTWGYNAAGDEYVLDTNLNSHVSSEGLVCVGNSIYRCIQKTAQSAGVAYVDVQHICKVKDIDTNGSMHGDLTSAIGGRYANSLSHWVSERYVALAVGGGEQAFAVTNKGTDMTPVNLAASGIESNERTVVFDVYATQATAVEIAPGVTSLCNGWSTSTSGDESVSCAFERPIITGGVNSAARGAALDWADGNVTYRAVAVCSVGGVESFVASPPFEVDVDPGFDLVVTIKINARASKVRKIRLYRNSSPMPAGDYQFVGETDAPTGSVSSVTITDNRLTFESSPTVAEWRPFDPTGGGVTLQGIAPAGLRDIAQAGGRTYVATSSYVIPCQEPQGDDQLPTPMVDILVQSPSRLGAIKHINALADMLIVSTENAIVGLAGDPPNSLGQGALQVPVIISENTGCNGKPIETPAGLFVPRERGITLVDRSRNAQEVFTAVSGDDGGAIRTLSGACAYSVANDEAYFKAGGKWLVLNVKSGRWTEWNYGISGSTSVATANRGPNDSAIVFSPEGGNGGIATEDSASYASPSVYLGWDSFPDRFSECKVGRIMVDGYRSDTNDAVEVSIQSAYDLDAALTDPVLYTVPVVGAAGPDNQGFRVQIAPARAACSSYRAVLVFTPDTATTKLNIETIAVDVLESVKRNVAGTEPS